ncbi:MAG TPA: DUF2490 domain-containing protein [Panacibacter sp.]|nr:DUF2490 domain-containing protein [Panacibacter sp.]
MKLIPKLILINLLVLSVAKMYGQTPVNFTGWYGYEGYHPFTEGKPWGFFGEGYIKRNHGITDRMQEFLRLGINYSLPNGNRITGGFAYQYNVPYDEVSESYNWGDYRIWEQYMIRKPKANGMWVHRFRMEQRWLERKSDPELAETDELKFENTFRYLLRRTFTLNPKVYAILYDEVHIYECRHRILKKYLIRTVSMPVWDLILTKINGGG